MVRPYRSRSRLVLDVLRAVRDEGEAHTNRVLLRANLSYDRLQNQVQDLQERGWIEPVEGAPTKAWRLTPEGRAVLVSLEEVDELMRDFGLGL